MKNHMKLLMSAVALFLAANSWARQPGSGIHSICPRPVVARVVNLMFLADRYNVVVIGPNGEVQTEGMSKMNGPETIPYSHGHWECNVTVVGANSFEQVNINKKISYLRYEDSGSLEYITRYLADRYDGPLNLYWSRFIIERTGRNEPETDIYTMKSY